MLDASRYVDHPNVGIASQSAQRSMDGGNVFNRSNIRDNAAAMAQAAEGLGLSVRSFIVSPCWSDPPAYVLLLDADSGLDLASARRLAEAADARLGLVNVEYESNRASGRLAPMTVEMAPAGRIDQFDRQRLADRGGTPEQFKHPFLITELDFHVRFLSP